MKYRLPLLFLALVLGALFIYSSLITPQSDVEAATPKIKIVLVPGHDNDYWGTQYRNFREADLNLQIAEYVEDYFKNDSRFEVVPVRNAAGYTKIFADYFANEAPIRAFIEERRESMVMKLESGETKLIDGVSHNDANRIVETRLFGINKWVNENGADLVLHIHINDYPRKNTRTEGKYTGFTIYVPERQYPNAPKSSAIAKSIFDRLSTFKAVSTLPKESAGIVEDQKLIAIGTAYSLRSAPAVLVEYGYIYDTEFIFPTIRPDALKEMAYQTYLGLTSYFNKEPLVISPYKSSLLPHEWKAGLQEGSFGADVLSLDKALSVLGFYPPAPANNALCALSGYFGPCLTKAVKNFQKSKGISPTGVVGPLTRAALNKLFSK